MKLMKTIIRKLSLFCLMLLIMAMMVSCDSDVNSSVEEPETNTVEEEKVIESDSSNVNTAPQANDITERDVLGIDSTDADVPVDRSLPTVDPENAVSAPVSNIDCEGMNYKEIELLFLNAGFENVETISMDIEKNDDVQRKDGEVVTVYYGDELESFDKGKTLDKTAKIVIGYVIVPEERDVLGMGDGTIEDSQEVPDRSVTDSSSSTSVDNSVIVPTQEDTEGDLVWVPTNGGTKYHSKSSCSNMVDPIQVTKEHAEANGYTPCKRCH